MDVRYSLCRICQLKPSRYSWDIADLICRMYNIRWNSAVSNENP